MNRTLPLLIAAMITLPACSDSDDGARATAGSPEGGTPGPCSLPGSLDAVVAVYGSAWNERDGEARLCALEASLTADATYVDPTVDTATREALSDSIAEFLASVGDGASIDQTSALDARDGELRFRWEFRRDGATVIKGLDYMELDGDGRISSIRGYWDPLPATPPEGPLAKYQDAVAASDASARRAALAGAVTDAVVFTGPDTSKAATGLDGAATAMKLDEGATITILGTQAYPKFARTEFEVKTGDDVTHGADYLHLDGDGKITRIARFLGEFPEL